MPLKTEQTTVAFAAEPITEHYVLKGPAKIKLRKPLTKKEISFFFQLGTA